MTDYRRLFELTGKLAVVLGAASGIGKSSAEALADLGATVVCADRDGGGAEATAAGIRERGGAAEAIVADAARPRPADRSRLYRWESSQRTCLDLITALPNTDQN